MKACNSLLLAASLALGSAVPASAESFEILLKIEPIASGVYPVIVGESTFPGHNGDISIASFKLGVINGLSPGKAVFKPLTVYKYLDKATPPLLLACSMGAHYKKATLVIANSPNTGFAAPPVRATGDFFKVVMEDVFVTAVNQDANTTDGNGNLLESVELSYLRIVWSYYAPDGSVTTGGWDVQHNKKITPPVSSTANP